MKESISATSLMQIVIVFIFIFTAIICVAINYASSYKTKNDIIKYIERFGMEKAKSDEYAATLKNNGYSDYGDCSGLEPGATDNSAKGYLFCYEQHTNNSASELEESVYYDVIVFFHIDLPFVNQMHFKVKGSTKYIYES